MSAYQELSQRLNDEANESKRRYEALARAASAIGEAIVEYLDVPADRLHYQLDAGEFKFGPPAVARRKMDLTISFKDSTGTEVHAFQTSITLESNGHSVQASLSGYPGGFMVVSGGPGMQSITEALERGMRESMPWEK